MKKLFLLKSILITSAFVFCFNITLSANWQKSDTTPDTQYTPDTQHSNSDSLPSGVTQDWLNSLTDERGNRIIPEEDPEGDALQQQTFDGAAAGNNYGRSVSSAGDVNGDGFDDVIIGAPNNSVTVTNRGRAYIYFGGTIIDNSPDVLLTGGGANYYSGSSVSGAGDVNGDGYDDVIVGAPGYNTFMGRVYIYYGGASMNSVVDVIMTGEFQNNEFGSSVSGAGDVNGDGFSDVIVGAYAANVYTGKAYVFYGGVSMNNVADVTMTGEGSSNYFGSSVSGAGDVNGDGYQDVICGASGFNGTGRTYIYFGSVSMDNIADVTMIGGAISDFFGASVSSAGDVNDDGYSDVIIGAYGYSSTTGRVYIFYGGASMNSIADVIMTGEAANNSFGYSVSEAGDVNGDGFADVYVGAYGISSSKGRAYLYYGGANMNNAADIFMTGETSLDYFGYSVSGAGDVNGDGFADMIAGAFGYNSNTGRAYVYTNTMTGEDIPDLIFNGEAVADGFGVSVSDAGDVNHDGYNDVIVGALWANANNGRAYIYYGSMFMDNVADVTLDGNSEFGFCVSGAGDVNGDSYGDVVVSTYKYDSDRGAAFIFYGGNSMDNIADVTLTGEASGVAFGASISGAGDVNGDGYDDVIAGASVYDNLRGRSYIYFGGPVMNNVADVIFTGETIQGDFGNSVSCAGDVNSDGFDDVIVGAQFFNNFYGRAYIFFGGSVMNNVADVIMTGESNSTLGQCVSDCGDVNGDGYGDVIIGPNISGGKVWIYYGGAVMNNTADIVMTGQSAFGWSVSGVGDVNSDGYSDVLIGTYGYASATGKADIYFGGISMDTIPDITMKGEYINSFFGASVSGAGDLNNDGYTDMIIGSDNVGKAYIYLSSPPDNRKNLFLFGAIQGLYDAVTDTEVADTIKVYLRNSTSPFARVDSSKNILLGPQTGQNYLFRNVQNGIPYYIEVTHRNALTTWSADPVTFVNSDASIAYSVNSIYAYGNNEIQVDNNPYDVFAFYSGDVNQNGYIDLTDVIQINNAANTFTTGYVVTDLTGNNAVDLTDVIMAYNNSVSFVSVVKP